MFRPIAALIIAAMFCVSLVGCTEATPEITKEEALEALESIEALPEQNKK